LPQRIFTREIQKFTPFSAFERKQLLYFDTKTQFSNVRHSTSYVLNEQVCMSAHSKASFARCHDNDLHFNFTCLVDWIFWCKGICACLHRSDHFCEMRYPSAVDRNIYLAYIRKESASSHGKKNEAQQQQQQDNQQQILDAINLNWDLNYPESLVELCIKVIAENWSSEYFPRLIYR
jgi:hypothetical protein